MNLATTFSIALKALWTNKVRSFLTMLGVIIGVGSVVMLTAIGNGLSAYVTNEFNNLGANTLFVFPGDVFGENGGFSGENQISGLANSKLRLSDVNDLQRLRDVVDLAVPFTLRSDKISFGATEKNVSLLGTTHHYFSAFNTPVGVGREFSKADVEGGEKVIVLGHTLAEELFGQIDPIGKRIKVGSQTFTVAGVADKKGGGFGGPSFDTYGYIPLETFFKQYDTTTIVRIIIKINDPTAIEESKQKISTLLNRRLKEDDFSLVDQSEILATINQILGVLTVGLGGIAAISLVVGGIGIMNIMLVSVTERTREIGLRKALGATPNVILLQFLIEAALLSVLGGMIGVGLAFLGSAGLRAAADIPAQVTMEAIALAFGVSTVVGLVFGAAPARRAANLSPIEALRYE